MSNFIKFYHFNTKESRDNTEIDDTSISFCKEDMSIETHGVRYGVFEWDEIPMSEELTEKIEEWVQDNMIFYYDMSKPADIYVNGITFANTFLSNGGSCNFNYSVNRCIITRTPTTNANISFWQKALLPLETVPEYKIKVTGLPEGFTIKGRLGYDSIQITEDGEYDIKSYTNTSSTNTTYPGFYFSGDNVDGVSCNITVEQIPTENSLPTNEVLKSNPYLQDLSGSGHPLRLYNFSFSEMSGVGGYEYNWLDSTLFITYLGGVRGNGTITSNTITISSVNVSSGVIESRVSSPSKKYKVKVTGITSDETLRYVVYGDTSLGENGTIIFDMKKDGEYELPASTYSATYNMKWQVIAASYPHTCNITVEQIPLYPNSLVVDGIDDYGKVQNFNLGIRMLLYTCIPFSKDKILYDQRSYGSFAIYNDDSTYAYNSRNKNGRTYIDGRLNSDKLPSDLLNKKQVIAIIGDVNGSKTPVFFSNNDATDYFSSLAFYNSMGFYLTPKLETDGFTESQLISYLIKNYLG